MAKRSIVPVLNRCGVCKETESAEHKDHEYQRDKTLSLWHGWYSLRRFVATKVRMEADSETSAKALGNCKAVADKHYIKPRTVLPDVRRAVNDAFSGRWNRLSRHPCCSPFRSVPAGVRSNSRRGHPPYQWRAKAVQGPTTGMRTLTALATVGFNTRQRLGPHNRSRSSNGRGVPACRIPPVARVPRLIPSCYFDRIFLAGRPAMVGTSSCDTRIVPSE